MQTYDNKAAEFYTNGCAAHMNGTELTRMKEVAFEKNPSEPMVCNLSLQAYSLCILDRFIFIFCAVCL